MITHEIHNRILRGGIQQIEETRIAIGNLRKHQDLRKFIGVVPQVVDIPLQLRQRILKEDTVRIDDCGTDDALRITGEENEIAKNYLDEKELKRLNNLVSAFFDLAELRAEAHQPMYMKDWIHELDDFASRYGQGVLVGAGTANHKGAMTKAHKEYDAYRARIASEETAADRAFLDGIKGLQKKIEGGKDD